MENTKKATMLAKMKETIVSDVEKASKAISAGKLKDLNAVDAHLAKMEKAYEALSMEMAFDSVLSAENPVLECIKKYSFTTLKHAEKKSEGDDKHVIGYEVVERERQIDLLRFCKYAKEYNPTISTDWEYSAAKLNQLLCLRTAKELKCSDLEIKEIAKSYYLKEQAKRIELGGTPTSNTQIAKALQTVIDAIIFDDDGKGKNKYLCNNHDVAFILACYTRKGKSALSVSVSKDAYFRKILTEVCLRIVDGGKYTVDGYRKIKE